MAKKLPPIHPGEILREEFLVPLRLTPYAVAAALDVPRTRPLPVVGPLWGGCKGGLRPSRRIDLADAPQNLTQNAANEIGLSVKLVMPGLVPGIHVLAPFAQERRGWPGQARP